jgi:hypothetical protein
MDTNDDIVFLPRSTVGLWFSRNYLPLTKLVDGKPVLRVLPLSKDIETYLALVHNGLVRSRKDETSFTWDSKKLEDVVSRTDFDKLISLIRNPLAAAA